MEVDTAAGIAVAGPSMNDDDDNDSGRGIIVIKFKNMRRIISYFMINTYYINNKKHHRLSMQLLSINMR